MGKPQRKDTAEIVRPRLARIGAVGDELPCDYEVMRAIMMTLLAAYYRSRPGDTRFEKAALAALPPAHRVRTSAQLNQIIQLTKTWARQAETELRRERDASGGR
jgi:hypothetical protein